MRATFIFLIATLTGCGTSVQGGTPGGEIELDVEPNVASAGETVELVLENETPGEIGYNLCTSTLERRTSGGWEGVPADRVCTMELRIAAAGETVRYPYDLPQTLEPGEYRFLANVHMMAGEERRSIWSETFRVQ